MITFWFNYWSKGICKFDSSSQSSFPGTPFLLLFQQINRPQLFGLVSWYGTAFLKLVQLIQDLIQLVHMWPHPFYLLLVGNSVLLLQLRPFLYGPGLFQALLIHQHPPRFLSIYQVEFSFLRTCPLCWILHIKLKLSPNIMSYARKRKNLNRHLSTTYNGQ